VHEKHTELFDNSASCHVVPQSFDVTGHIDAPQAEVDEQGERDCLAATCAASYHGDEKTWNNF